MREERSSAPCGEFVSGLHMLKSTHRVSAATEQWVPGASGRLSRSALALVRGQWMGGVIAHADACSSAEHIPLRCHWPSAIVIAYDLYMCSVKSSVPTSTSYHRRQTARGEYRDRGVSPT